MINGRRFRTVREIMEHFIPGNKPVTGEELAEKLLAGFRRDSKPCDAVIHHGPGHQSKTLCYLTGVHEIHETIYGWEDVTARWRGDKVCSGYFNEPPPDPDECTNANND